MHPVVILGGMGLAAVILSKTDDNLREASGLAKWVVLGGAVYVGAKVLKVA